MEIIDPNLFKSNISESKMDQFKINGPQDYSKYFHTNSEGLVWVDGRGNPIPLDME